MTRFWILSLAFALLVAQAAFARAGSSSAAAIIEEGLALSPSPATSRTCAVRLRPSSDVQRSIERARAGSVLCLGPGVYSGPWVFEFETGRGVTVRGEGAGATVLDAGGATDGVLVLNTAGVTLEELTIRGGQPAGIYAFNSQDIMLNNLELLENGIGVHFDRGSRGTLRDSTVTASARDGVLIRREAGATVTGNRIARNGVVGVSGVGDTARTRVASNRIEENGGPGIFAGVAPCHGLFIGQLRSPACFSKEPGSYLVTTDFVVEDNVIRGNKSSGLVFFPGSKGLLMRNVVLDNDLTGLFSWGAEVNAYYNRFTDNEEHAVEYRTYPRPFYVARSGEPFPLRAKGWLIGNSLRTSREIDGTIGGGLLSQGAHLLVFGNRVWNNAGLGISLVNDSIGFVFGNTVEGNGDAGICINRSTTIRVFDNVLRGNFSDTPGSCAQR